MEQVRNTRQVRSKADAAAVDLASRIQAAAKILLGEGHAQSPLLADVDACGPADRL